jgi:octanoyl-[GcvH]:protein N-octanoyltransferase
VPAARAGGVAPHASKADQAEVILERLRLIRHSFPDQPELGTAVSQTILRRVAAGELPPTIRIHRPGREVAFGRQDVASRGYPAAAEAARAAGFAAVERLAGGRAAVFHEGTIAIARAYSDPQPPKRTYARFEEMAEVITAAVRGMGVDARVGEVPGEYCPGAYSVNARATTKLAGIGQRMIRGGAHVGGVVVASGGDEIARVLVPVYEALELDWEPATSGSVAGELGREVDAGELEEALIAELGRRYDLVDAELDEETMRRAAEQVEAVKR